MYNCTHPDTKPHNIMYIICILDLTWMLTDQKRKKCFNFNLPKRNIRLGIHQNEKADPDPFEMTPWLVWKYSLFLYSVFSVKIFFISIYSVFSVKIFLISIYIVYLVWKGWSQQAGVSLHPAMVIQAAGLSSRVSFTQDKK